MSEQSADWHEMEASFDLDRMIAEKLGWKVVRVSANYQLLPGMQRHCIISPDGKSEEFDDWRELDLWHGVETFDLLPRFSTDLNAAFTLFSTELGLEWNLFSYDDDWITCELGHLNPEPPHDQELVQATEKTAALAIVRAMLKWWERPDHPAPELPKGKKS